MSLSTWRNFMNGGSTFLNTAYTAGGTTLNVYLGGVFSAPASGQNFTVRVDDEIFLVTAISGNNLTVVGAQEGTTAANHALGAFVFSCMTADCAERLRQQLNLESTSGAPASPTYATPLRVAFDPATNKLYVWNGSAWKSVTLT